MTHPVQPRRLHFLNALFAPLTGHDLYLAEQLDGAIRSTLPPSDEEPTPDTPAYVAAAARLFEKLCVTRSSHGFYHWDASAESAGADPLFARAGLMEGLKRLASCTEATVLVTNLRTAHCPPAARWTPRRQRQYDDTLTFLRDLAAARTRRGANVNLLFL